jgi:hypothetical protein
LKLGIWNERRIKKNIAEVIFFKTSKWRIKSRWRQQPLFFYFSYLVKEKTVVYFSKRKNSGCSRHLVSSAILKF